MVKYFDFQQLPGADEVACDFDVRFGRGRVAAYAGSGISGVIPDPVLCRMADDLPGFSLSEPFCDAA